MMDCDPLANHVVLLIKCIAEKYLQVRYYYAGRQFTDQMHEHKTQKISRQVYTKLVIFSGRDGKMGTRYIMEVSIKCMVS